MGSQSKANYDWYNETNIVEIGTGFSNYYVHIFHLSQAFS